MGQNRLMALKQSLPGNPRLAYKTLTATTVNDHTVVFTWKYFSEMKLCYYIEVSIDKKATPCFTHSQKY